jgi:hypothetical protein
MKATINHIYMCILKKKIKTHISKFQTSSSGCPMILALASKRQEIRCEGILGEQSDWLLILMKLREPEKLV